MSKPTTRLCVVYHFLPNYRQGVFDALVEDPRVDVHFLAGSERPGQEGVPEADLEHTHLENRWILGRVLWQRRLVSELRALEPDAVVYLGSWTYLSTWWSAPLIRRSGASVLFWTHGWTRRETGVRRQARVAFYSLADRLLLYGDLGRRLAVEHGVPGGKLTVVGNSLPEPAPSIVDVAEPGLVLWVARLLPAKRLDLAVRAVAHANEKGHDLRLRIVGDGPGLSEATELAGELGVRSNVEFLGAVHEPERLHEEFSRASVTVVPDFGGLTIPHALMHGCPVVANDDPTANGPDYEYLHADFDGTHFAAGDTEDLADRLITWAVSNRAGSEQRDRIAERARNEASPLRSAKRIVDAVLELG